MTDKFIQAVTLTNQTAVIRARTPGQMMVLGSQIATAETEGDTLRLYGSGKLFLSTGDWDLLTTAAGNHPTLPAFSGRTQSSVDIQSMDVYRQIDDGTWVLIADDIPAASSITDPLPTLNGLNRYRVVTKSALESEATGPEAEIEVKEPGYIYLNWGVGWGSFVRWYGNVKLGGSTVREKTLHRFAGRKYPVAFFGESRSQKITVAGRLTPDSSSLYEVEDALDEATVICFRDPKGRKIFGVAGELSHQWESPTLCSVNLEVERVDHDERATA